MKDDPAIAALLAEARAQFAVSLPAKTAELEALVARGAWDEARRAAHKLRGSSGTYGFAALSVAAGAIEDELIAAGGAPGEDVRARVNDRVREAKAEAARAVSGPIEVPVP